MQNIKDEADTIAKAGFGNAITVSTSVAGRGTDIKPSPDAIKAGGLMVIGTDLLNPSELTDSLKDVPADKEIRVLQSSLHL